MTTTPTTTPTSGAADLRTAAQAVVDRWDTPLWKDVPATAEYIGRLRAALAAGQAPAAPAQPVAQQGVAYAALEKKHADFVETVGLMLAAIGYKEDYARQWPKEKASVTFRRWFDEQRASHGQAPATQQAGDLARLLKEILADACHYESETNLRAELYQRLYDAHAALTATPQPTPPAQAAESVQEDAARAAQNEKP